MYTVWIIYTATHLLLELTIWYLSGNSRLTAASTWLTHGKKNLHLTATCIRLSRRVLNACLIPIWKQSSDGRLYTAASWHIEQPPYSRLQMAAWRVKKHLSLNSCLTAFPKWLYGGWYDSGNVYKWFTHENLFPNFYIINLSTIIAVQLLHGVGGNIMTLCIPI